MDTPITGNFTDKSMKQALMFLAGNLGLDVHYAVDENGADITLTTSTNTDQRSLARQKKMRKYAEDHKTEFVV